MTSVGRETKRIRLEASTSPMDAPFQRSRTSSGSSLWQKLVKEDLVARARSGKSTVVAQAEVT